MHSRLVSVRVLRNVMVWGSLCAIMLWLMRAWLWQNRTAVLLGVAAGSLFALWRWRRLSRRIARRHRRFDRNKVFVHYVNAVEALLSAVAYNPYLAIPIGVLLFAGVLLSVLSGAWWAILVAAFGLTSCGMLAGCIIGYERRHGPLHYQYDSRMWSGAEGMLYRTATVVKPLTPAGKVDYQGELWNAVSLSGDPIDVGDRVEVISVERLTLYVDRAPQSGPSAE
jgi:membrane protein implicated in regulation of membrane protease activity